MSCSSNSTPGKEAATEAPKAEPATYPPVQAQPWGKSPEGQQIELYTLTNGNGMEAKISDFGGAVVSLKVPDKSGQMADVVLGYDSVDGYEQDISRKSATFFGVIIGRYGNRIGKARFTLNGIEYRLAANNGVNTLHGGVKGFGRVAWNSRIASNAEGPAVELAYLSQDGEEGYPGNLTATVTYTLTADNGLKIEYKATSDRDTVVNLTNHSYFNLAGEGQGDILGHLVTIYADRITPTDAGLIPTGELQPVDGTPFDFRKPTAIGARINDKNPVLVYGKGYDINYVLNRASAGLLPAAKVVEPNSGRVMEVLTTEPGLQFYSGNFLDGSVRGKGGKAYQYRSAFCMETQHFPDSPNRPSFPTTVLKKDEEYHSITVYRFSAE